jgi:hypothetical protein
MAERNE